MPGGYSRLRGDCTSIKYNWSPVGKSYSEVADFPREEYVSPISDNINKKCGKGSTSKTHEILSTPELVTAVGQIWDYASRPLASFKNDVNSRHGDQGSKNEVILRNVDSQEDDVLSISTRTQYFSVDLRTDSYSPSQVQPTLDFVKVTDKLSASEPFSKNSRRAPFWRLLQGHTKVDKEPWRQHGFTSVEVSCDLESMYGWMKQIAFSGPKSPTEGSNTEKMAGECCSISGDSTVPSTSLVSPGNPQAIKSCNLPSLNEAKSKINTRSSLYSDYFLATNLDAQATISGTAVSDLYKEYYVQTLVTDASKDSEHKTNDNQLSDTKCKEDLVAEDSSNNELLPQAVQKPPLSFAKQEHAFAGAFAGIFVSLCLHPIDTVKTVVQSCRVEQKSLFYIGRSLVSERGLTGLYRGITTNIASSAPISAIYTFTYESVKGALLPRLPKEYNSFAHCVAGGCASIGTSFVFTPSERIKQQMQVGSHYSNCWNALVGILRNGGIRSLYNGWGAVLWRNVPHSIIKFYTYESLKQLTSPSLSTSTQPNTLQTLVCGGLAGSTAAFFTTPFDVVKTRLQTQVPGATSQYNSVIHALLQISKNEGLKGLYRGLTPRLVMYVSQGALFFASYEFFKKFLCSETRMPESERMKRKENKEEKSSFIPSPLSVTPSLVSSSSATPTKLPSLHSS